ncbi:hypothetical protein, partial [Calditerricola satsumensis]|uniref:hypothetical protein n=1 Tax=Calditerricola satsumensis TaxID=373054 RepID=UPI001C47859F
EKGSHDKEPAEASSPAGMQLIHHSVGTSAIKARYSSTAASARVVSFLSGPASTRERLNRTMRKGSIECFPSLPSPRRSL